MFKNNLFINNTATYGDIGVIRSNYSNLYFDGINNFIGNNAENGTGTGATLVINKGILSLYGFIFIKDNKVTLYLIFKSFKILI
jgi:hypothetical protein